MRIRLALALVVLAIGGVVGLRLVRGRLPNWSSGNGQQAIVRFCTTCHDQAAPDLLPRDAWAEQVKLMYQLSEEQTSGPVADQPPVQVATAYYQQRAPQRLDIWTGEGAQAPGRVAFEHMVLRHLIGQARHGAVTHVQFARLKRDGPLELLVCEGQYGLVLAASPARPTQMRSLATVPAACHVDVADLDGDGIRDLLVASLGELSPTDATKGGVYWLKGDRRGGFHTVPLVTGLGRVSDVRAGDFDRDGDCDLIVAEFGFRKRGGIYYFENVTAGQEVPVFDIWPLDSRAGTVHVPVVDLDGDGDLDFVALISQQFETVVAFLNSGAGSFSRQPLFSAGHPAWGSSGMQIVDLDGDGDLDMLLTNGDTFDNFVLKPYHSIGWLENLGTGLQFQYHRLAPMPAVYCAEAGDLDGDGDQDIMAGAYFAPPADYAGPAPESLVSLMWLEQTGVGRFKTHVLERGRCVHPSLDLADYDGDGDADAAVAVWPAGPYQLDSSKEWPWVRLLQSRPNRAKSR